MMARREQVWRVQDGQGIYEIRLWGKGKSRKSQHLAIERRQVIGEHEPELTLLSIDGARQLAEAILLTIDSDDEPIIGTVFDALVAKVGEDRAKEIIQQRIDWMMQRQAEHDAINIDEPTDIT